MNFAAIDIGSNAIRLLICNVYEVNSVPVFRKITLVRVPIRLGEDVFTEGRISEKNTSRLVKSMTAFKNLMDVYDVISYRACATSAMRDALNNEQVIEQVKNESGITIEIIGGGLEAEIIYSNHVTDYLDDKNAYLYIDIGGGSVELTLTSKNIKIASQSFNLGTVRQLKNNAPKQEWSNLKRWIKNNIKDYKPLIAIGTGGNINKLNRLANPKDNSRPLTFKKLKEVDSFLNSFSLKDRIEILKLNPDRADVIIPASKTVLNIMKHAGINKMIVPQLGLSDGIVHLLYEEHVSQVVEKV